MNCHWSLWHLHATGVSTWEAKQNSYHNGEFYSERDLYKAYRYSIHHISVHLPRTLELQTENWSLPFLLIPNRDLDIGWITTQVHSLVQFLVPEAVVKQWLSDYSQQYTMSR